MLEPILTNTVHIEKSQYFDGNTRKMRALIEKIQAKICLCLCQLFLQAKKALKRGRLPFAETLTTSLPAEFEFY